MQLSKLKLKHQILFIFLLAIFLFMMMEIYFYYSFYHLTQKRAANYGHTIIEQTRQKIDSVFDDIIVSTNIVVSNKKIQEFTIAEDNYKRNIEIGTYVIDLMDYMRSFNSYVSGIIISDSKGRRVFSSSPASSEVFF
ncbi:CHASE3 domain-containing protein [Paenibacillus daejeonensis]|uniref:CHASE3 domain-containing protein n=1 Tax=Paenibacillus daejeonensis TaxID=135193 RepID=UPI00037FB065|nr:cache domain-containing protein [Paenibacillus daejeonensis]